MILFVWYLGLAVGFLVGIAWTVVDEKGRK